MMILIAHITFALASLVATAWAFLSPSKIKLYTAYILVGSTVATGIDLVFINSANLTQTCLTGLVYLIIISFGIVSVHNKLARVLV